MKFRFLTEELIRHKDRKAAIESLKDQIQTLEMEITGIKATSYDKDIVSGGGENIREARLVESIARLTELENDLKVTVRNVESVENALSGITETERHILTEMYVDRRYGAADRLMDEFRVESSQLYRMKDKALIHYGIRKYGQIQL